jgi:hypothetical protein
MIKISGIFEGIIFIFSDFLYYRNNNIKINKKNKERKSKK